MARDIQRAVNHRWGRLGLAAGSGMVLSTAFPPLCGAWVSFVALVPLFFLVDLACSSSASRRGRRVGWRSLFGYGWLFGFVFYAVLLSWIVGLTTARMVYPALKWPAWLVASAYLACYSGLFTLVLGLFRRRLGAKGMLAAPVTWTLIEVARGSGTLGFPWGSLAYGLVTHPSLIQGASLGGVDLLGFWVSAVNLALWNLLTSRGGTPSRKILSAVFVAVLLVGPWVWGKNRIPESPCERLGRAGLVQPSARGDEKWDPAHRDSSYRVLERGTLLLARLKVDLVVWPETAVPLYLRWDRDYFEKVRSLAHQTSEPLLVGFPDAALGEGDRVLKYNAAGLFDENGTLTDTYWKIHLVPFGETLPWQDAFSFLERIDLGEGDYSPGTAHTVFDSPVGRFSVLICFESIFPRLARKFVHEGAAFLVNITNDDWFGDTPAAAQHAAMAVPRAVENGVSLVRCANSGISGVVDPYGRIEERTALFKRMEVVVPISKPLQTTLYRRTGNAFLWLCVVVLCLGFGSAVLSRT